MSIYDDLLKIIEEAKVHNIHQDYFGCVQFEEALERAKKEHELLELYNHYFEINQIQVLNGGHSYGDSRRTNESIDCIVKINTKKKELEELK